MVMPTTVLRDRSGGEVPAVTNMELFFDLVYVFAVTPCRSHSWLRRWCSAPRPPLSRSPWRSPPVRPAPPRDEDGRP